MRAETRSLNSALRDMGEDIIVRRYAVISNTKTAQDVQCKAVVRSVASHEIAGKITQSDFKVILSPTNIINASWPSNAQAPATILTATDPRIPKSTDKVVCRGKEREVKTALPFFVDGEWVRMELIVEG